MPRLLPPANPRFRPTSMRLMRLPYASRRNAAESSVEPLSTTITSRCGYVWRTTEARHSGRWLAPFQLTMMTETSGRSSGCGRSGREPLSASVATRTVFGIGSLKMDSLYREEWHDDEFAQAKPDRRPRDHRWPRSPVEGSQEGVAQRETVTPISGGMAHRSATPARAQQATPV